MNLTNLITTSVATSSFLLLLSGCGILGSLGAATCPALRPGVSALDASFSTNAQVNGKVAAFVQASKDIAGSAARLEAEVTGACQRMARDLQISPQQLRARKGHGGAAAGACNAVATRMDAILRQGVQIGITVQPPRCQANAQAQAHCGGRCNVSNDAECRASCQAHANVHASCSRAVVTVNANNTAQGAALVATLRANLPALITAQIALGKRLVGDAKVVAQVGARLPKVIGKASAQALACIGGAADIAGSASVKINVSVQASASVSGRVGG